MADGYDFKRPLYNLEYKMDIPQLLDSGEIKEPRKGTYLGKVDGINVKIVLNKNKKSYSTLYAKTRDGLNKAHRRISDILDEHEHRDFRSSDF